jgi:hypothetical protein
MEQAHLRVLLQALVEVPEWVEREREGWVVPKQVKSLKENACVQTVGRLFLMNSESPVTLRNAQNAVQRW